MEPQSFSAGEPEQVLAAARERGDMQRRGFKHRSVVLLTAAMLLVISLVVSVGRESPRATPVFAQAVDDPARLDFGSSMRPRPTAIPVT
jgi:hypothetical protein